MRFPRSHYQACLEADVLTESSGLGSSKHDSSASVTATKVMAIIQTPQVGNQSAYRIGISYTW